MGMYIDKTKLISADISVWLSSLLRELTKMVTFLLCTRRGYWLSWLRDAADHARQATLHLVVDALTKFHLRPIYPLRPESGTRLGRRLLASCGIGE